MTTVISTVAGAVLGVAISLPVERLIEAGGPRRPFEDTHFLQRDSGFRLLTEKAVRLSPTRQRIPRVLVGGKGKPGASFNARRGEIRLQQRLIDEAPPAVLYGVFAHELGHIIFGRPTTPLWRYVVGLAGAALPTAIGIGIAFDAQSELAGTVAVLLAFFFEWWLPNSRRNEIAADVASLKLVQLETAIIACEWIGMDPGWSPPTWLSAHPSTATRVAALKAAAAAEETDIRAWALTQGFNVSERGRIDQSVINRYRATH